MARKSKGKPSSSWEQVEEQVLPVLSAAELVAAVKKHAMNNYDGTEGWDFVVECWSDNDIIECIGDAATAKQAIDRVREITNLQAELRSDICNA
jgi:hypothetical protein